jgi:PhoH-like ATPase
MIHRKPASNVARFPASASPSTVTRLFVLDTNVLMHDPTCLFRFQEHDVYIPIAILEELDNNKKGMSEVARNARQASRYLDELVSGSESSISDGIALFSRPRRSPARCRRDCPRARARPTTRSSAS